MVLPRHHTARNPARPTRGKGVAAIALAKGRPLMPWQRRAVDVALEVDPATGRYWYGIVVVSVPRQSGKTTLLSDVADHRCLTTKRGRAWITMQTGKDAADWMRDEHFAGLDAGRSVFGVPDTSSCRYKLSLRAGGIGVAWPSTGSTFRAFPPTRKGLHSKQGDLVVVDEAWVFDAEQGAELRQAIRPTMATRKGAQLWIVSTMGDDASDYLQHYIDLALDSLDVDGTRVCFIDYGIPDDADPDDFATILEHHPAYGHTIDLEALEAARDEFAGDPAGWARAYGNRSTTTRRAVIDPTTWSDAGKPEPDVPALVGLGLDVTPRGDRYALARSWIDDDGRRWRQLVDAGPVSGHTAANVVDWWLEHAGAQLVYERTSYGALDLVDAIGRELRRRRLRQEPVGLDAGAYASACTELLRGLTARTECHANQPELDAAIGNLATRNLGDGAIGWARRTSSGSIAEAVAATIAARAFDLAPTALPKAKARGQRRPAAA